MDFQLNQTSLNIEVDTGASVSVISRDMYNKLWPSARALAVLGMIHVEVHCNNQTATLPLVVVKGGGPSLFGRDWL